MRAYAKRLDIEDYVQWIGYVDEADKPSLYRLAKVFAFPSEYEGFGLTPLEAMACGTPTVTFNEPIFDEILEEGAYLVEDARQMAGALIALLIQAPFHEAMVNQGLAQVTKYNWRKTAKGTLEAYQKVVEKVVEV
jgi:glycosyltransferase involved in cell wall biosynthesis